MQDRFDFERRPLRVELLKINVGCMTVWAVPLYCLKLTHLFLDVKGA